MKKWYKGVYRRQLTDMHISAFDESFLSEFSADEYYENLVRAKIQSPMIYLQSHTGLCNYQTETAEAHPRFLSGENEIKRLIKKCKDGGMKVVGYYSLIFNNVATLAHPEWEMRFADGHTWRDEGQRYGLCCPNNEEYREFLKLQIDELAREFKDLDGIFFDMPYWEVTCACDSCRKKFKEAYGAEIPEKQDFRDKAWLDYVKARQEFMVDFVRFVKSYTAAVMPWVTVEFNYAAVIGCDWLGGSTEGINAECEFTGGDLYGDLYSHSFAAKYYYGVTKNQPFEYMTCRCDKTLREHTISKPKRTLENEILLTCAHHGASLIIDAVDPIGTLDERIYDRVGKAFERQIPFEPYMDKGELFAEAAVYFDSRTMFSLDGSDRYNKTAAVGAVKKLVEEHVPVAVVANGALDDLSRYQAVIAPSLHEFDNGEPMKLIEYVKEGGTLYLSGESDPRLMKEFFGAKAIGTTYGDSEKRHVQLGARVYLSPTKEGEALFGEFNAKYPLPLTYYLPLFTHERGRLLATITLPYREPDESSTYASIHSCPPWYSTDYPAMLEAEYGRGKVIWCAAELEYDDRRAISDVFKNVVLENIKRKYEISAGRSIESVIFEDDDKTLISLCDLTYDEDKKNKDATLKASFGKIPSRIYDIGGKRDVPFIINDNGTEFSVALQVDDFAMYEISYEK